MLTKIRMIGTRGKSSGAMASVCVAACIALSGCGGSSSSHSTSSVHSTGSSHTANTAATTKQTTAASPTKATYIAKADAICRAEKAKLAKLHQPVEPTNRSLKSAEAYLASIHTWIGTEMVDIRGGLDELKSLPMPAGDSKTLNEIWGLGDQELVTGGKLQPLLTSLQRILRTETTSQKSAFAQLQKLQDAEGAIETKGTQLGQRYHQLAKQFGFKVCGKPNHASSGNLQNTI